MFKKIFNKQEYQPEYIPYGNFRLLNNYDNYFSPWAGVTYDDATIRKSIHAVAVHAAKLQPMHVKMINQKPSPIYDSLNTLLAVRPNEYMSTFDFLYKVISQLYCYNNSFVFIKLDAKGSVIGLYPIAYENIELKEYQDKLYARFQFMQAGYITIPYEDLIHLRRFFNGNDIFGESNAAPLTEPLQILNIVKESLVNAVKNCTKLRGYLKINSNLREEDKKTQVKNFIDNMKSTDGGDFSGIGVVDNKADYHQLTSEITTADDSQMKYCRQDVYEYFGVSEPIVNDNYTEEQWNAFYQSVIGPLAVQMGQEFTAKIFTEREKGYGNAIIFYTDRLQYASTKTKVSVIQAMLPAGMISKNEARALFGWPPTEDGDKFQVSLNYVNSQKQDDYQGVGGAEDDDTDENNKGDDSNGSEK